VDPAYSWLQFFQFGYIAYVVFGVLAVMLIYGVLLALSTSLASWILEHMPKRKEPELTPAEQFKRFREAAKSLMVDETGKPLEEAFKKVSPKKPKAPAPR
jgi:uncharacterized iron-regulated membrane protein